MLKATLTTRKGNLVNKIDKKLAKLAKDKLHSIKYGVRICNNDSVFELLVSLREVYIKKLNGHECYNSYNLNTIEKTIQKYL